MYEQVRSRLAALGWGEAEFEFEVIFLNIIWLYLSAGLDASILKQCMNMDGSPIGNSQDAYWLALEEMLEQATQEGQLHLLAVPSVKTLEEVLDLLSSRFGDG